MNAEPVTEGIYTISQTDGKFKVVGGSLTEDGENLNSLTDAFNKILSFGTDTNININFDNVNISSGAPGAPKLTKGCELTLKGTYTSAAEAFIIKPIGKKINFIVVPFITFFSLHIQFIPIFKVTSLIISFKFLFKRSSSY